MYQLFRHGIFQRLGFFDNHLSMIKIVKKRTHALKERGF